MRDEAFEALKDNLRPKFQTMLTEFMSEAENTPDATAPHVAAALASVAAMELSVLLSLMRTPQNMRDELADIVRDQIATDAFSPGAGEARQ